MDDKRLESPIANRSRRAHGPLGPLPTNVTESSNATAPMMQDPDAPIRTVQVGSARQSQTTILPGAVPQFHNIRALHAPTTTHTSPNHALPTTFNPHDGDFEAPLASDFFAEFFLWTV
jgi:hypothetical protein